MNLAAAACQTCAVETIPLAVEREGVSADDVPAVERYILDQKRHHAFSAFEALLESD